MAAAAAALKVQQQNAYRETLTHSVKFHCDKEMDDLQSDMKTRIRGTKYVDIRKNHTQMMMSQCHDVTMSR